MTQTSILQRPGRFSIVAIALAASIGLFAAGPAFADHEGGHGHGGHDHGRNFDRHGQQVWHGDHDGYRNGNRNYYRDQRAYRHPYGYAQPVYMPPPVYYAPRQSPGVSLFFPLDLR